MTKETDGTYYYLSLVFAGAMAQIIWDIGTNDVILGYEFRLTIAITYSVEEGKSLQ